METKSLAKIAIRGKGSVKEGKGKSDAAHASNQDEDLHCLIMADTEEKIAKAKELIHQVIETVSLFRPFRFAGIHTDLPLGCFDPRRPERAQAQPVARARRTQRYPP